ncbi:alpha/beta hydrolase family protein [Kitasatospora sp. McL0602]|uniref:alpha/beta hydrolase family protein n=1 Tax=Kitasatospora sp. McL0602 TaxID=3439530 RepID=UPI003F88EAAD
MTRALQAPGFAALSPGRAVETRLVAGRCQAVAWDLATGHRRVLTDRPQGVDLSEIEPDGGSVWWFDADTSGEGRWLRQPYGGGEPGAALGGVPIGRAYGVAFDRLGTLAAVSIGVGGSSRCYLGPPSGEASLIGEAEGYLSLADLSPCGRLLALAGRPDGDDAVVIRPAESPSEGWRLRGGESESGQLRLWPLEFDPTATGEAELLLVAAQDGRYTVATWRASTGLRLIPRLSFDSEISAGWYGGARGVLVQHERAGRSHLLLADLHHPRTRAVRTPVGTIHDLSCAPDGALHCLWSRAAEPPRPLVLQPGDHSEQTDHADHARTAATAATATGARRAEHRTAQPYGPVHSFVTTPPGTGPWPTLFLVHGGPATHDRDSYDPRVERLTDAGYAVVRTNYRGSTGYGAQWQHGYGRRVGLAQIEDLAAVRAALVAEGVADAGRTGLCGFSWGGYLALLAVGAQPHLWSLAMAAYPIADYPAAYEATTPALRETDRELFGGSPAEVPERYRAASPLTYVRQVRSPVLLVASAEDERCPAEQVGRYAAELQHSGAPHELVWVEGGHRSRRASDHTAVLTAMLHFARRTWPDSPP